MKKEAIIFDFFDVVHEDPLKAWCRRYDIDRTQGVNDIAFRLDTGVITYGQYVTELAALNGQTEAELEAEFATAVLNEEMVSLIVGLRSARHKTALLSNTNHEEIDPIFERHGLAELFDEVVISSDVALAKPDSRIYQLMLERLNVKPEHAAFVDDNAENVAGAVSVGIHGIHFVGMPQLHQELGLVLV
jgi:epoxide hydrolase-like predicted phosphatase